MKWGLIFGAAVFLALLGVGLNTLSPYAEAPPKGVTPVPLASVKRGGHIVVKGPDYVDGTRHITLAGIIDWKAKRGIDGQGRPLSSAAIARLKAKTDGQGSAFGVYVEFKGIKEFVQIASVNGVSGGVSGSGGGVSYLHTDALLDLTQPLKVVAVFPDTSAEQRVAIIPADAKGIAQGFHWKMEKRSTRLEVMQGKRFTSVVRIVPPGSLTNVDFAFMSEEDDRTGVGFKRFEKWTEFEVGFMRDDRDKGIYGTIWSCPRWTLEFTCVPAS